MKFIVECLSVALAWPVEAADRYSVKGMIVAVNTAARIFTASIDEIPAAMAAMTMPFEVRDARQLQGLRLAPSSSSRSSSISRPRLSKACASCHSRPSKRTRSRPAVWRYSTASCRLAPPRRRSRQVPSPDFTPRNHRGGVSALRPSVARS